MQEIGIVFETVRNGSDQDMIDLFRRRLRRFYKGVHLAARFVISDAMDVPEDLLEAAHDTASRAEDEQRKTGSDFVAYLRPLQTILVDEPESDDDVTVVLIAVAHSRGIGSFCVSRPIASAPVPTNTCLLLIKQKTETESVMRPRTRDPDNEPAAMLGSHISSILEEIVTQT